MASSINSGSSSGRSKSVRSNSSAGQVLSYHDDIAPLRVVKVEGPTKGRCFYGYSHYPRTCGFFKWAVVVEEVRELQHLVFVKDAKIAKLEAQNYVLRNKLRKVRIKKADLANEVEELGIANTESLLEFKNYFGDKKLIVVCLILFGLVLLFK